MTSLFDAALDCLMTCAPGAKLDATARAVAAWREGRLGLAGGPPVRPVARPGRPPRPRLVAPGQLPRRGLGSAAGRAALVHAVAHIELNAVNLAWDAVYRFRGLPRAYYDDWVGVAADEARHFALLEAHLQGLGHGYGDFAAHDGLWDMAFETAHDPLVRMALVPRVLEARGLDVTPGMRARLAAHGDARAAEILDVILAEEVAHVAAGSRWYRALCRERGLVPEPTFRRLVGQYLQGGLKGPFNHAARRAAGFGQQELAALEAAR